MEARESKLQRSWRCANVYGFVLGVWMTWVADGDVLSQERSPIRNLRTGDALLINNWVAYTVEEQLRRVDLNGDGDTEDRVIHVEEFSTGDESNLRLAVEGGGGLSVALVSSNRISIPVSESAQGRDLNGDGDLADCIRHIHDLTTSETTNLGEVLDWCFFPRPVVEPDYWVESVSESVRGNDLNGDGDSEDLVVHVRDLATGRTRNLELAIAPSSLPIRVERWLLFAVSEGAQGLDLNGDDDLEDCVLHVHDLPAEKTTNVGLDWRGARLGDYQYFMGAVDSVPLLVREAGQGNQDLNGDGDTEDSVVHLVTLSRGETTNLEVAASNTQAIVGDWVVLVNFESDDGEDLNGDGDTEDRVLRLLNTSTGRLRSLPPGTWSSTNGQGDWLALSVWEGEQGEDLNGDGDRSDVVAHVHDLVRGESTNLGLTPGLAEFTDPFFVVGTRAIIQVSEWFQGFDLNGDGDTDDDVIHLVDLEALETLPRFLRGDCNDDGLIDISDAACILHWLFLSGAEPPCVAATNTDGIGDVDLTDPIYLLTHLFLGGPMPDEPFPDCGTSDLRADRALGCESPPKHCQQ